MKNIKKNNTKLTLIVAVMSLILILGTIAVINPTKYTSFIYRNGMIIFAVGIISTIVSTYFLYQFGSKLFDRNAIFSINSKGISDKINMLDYPNISWKDIIKIEEYNINNVPHLKVFVDNPQQYINQKKGFKKWVLNFNYKKYHTPILLNSTYLSCSFNDFKKSILDSYKEYHNSDD
ncbi:STM3941 family protein [Chryseobacterium lathyri]|uniref:STM3941 family protein n=1 Tax=Chryseobacterium lathyri TaxID=395933 RepID=UPI0027864E5C|nr:STM3941 family protein [Chryseobacterium lathyri]MDQ0066037.1 hypothetical protein [Chryseobacterium lathyri]